MRPWFELTLRDGGFCRSLDVVRVGCGFYGFDTMMKEQFVPFQVRDVHRGATGSICLTTLLSSLRSSHRPRRIH